jgi:hypothetical protein
MGSMNQDAIHAEVPLGNPKVLGGDDRSGQDHQTLAASQRQRRSLREQGMLGVGS